jgi:hypothetical protein
MTRSPNVQPRRQCRFYRVGRVADERANVGAPTLVLRSGDAPIERAELTIDGS